MTAYAAGTPPAAAVRVAGRGRAPFDPWLLGAVLALAALGLVMVYSASIAYAERRHGLAGYYLMRHGAYLIMGLAAMAVAAHTRSRWWQWAGPYLLLAGLVLSVAVLLPGLGRTVNGSTRWLPLGVMTVQPSEFMKLFMVVYVAGYLVRRQEQLEHFTRGILVVSLVVAVAGMLILQQPDLGSVVVISLTVLTMLFLGGVRFSHFLLVLVAGVGGMATLTLISPYRLERVTSFLDPWADPFGSGFQLTQALIAFGRGEWFGAGLGASVQKLFYLPAAHTDFLFAVIAEELGLLGVLGVIALFAVIAARGFAIARAAERAGLVFGARLAEGLTLLIAVQAIINMGVNMGMLPTKGLTLPFVSYGGSSLGVCFTAAGLLLRIEREARLAGWGREP
jgi:cell division protein FtsW